MNYNTDGFNERSIYIHNSNDKNKLNNKDIDNSFDKMRIEERKNTVVTTNTDKSEYIGETRGNKDKFILMNNNIRNVNSKPNINNPVYNALNKNMLRK